MLKLSTCGILNIPKHCTPCLLLRIAVQFVGDSENLKLAYICKYIVVKKRLLPILFRVLFCGDRISVP